MSRPMASPLVRVAVVVLAVAIVLCLAVPMMGGGDQATHLALACCFVLAAALSVFLLRRPGGALLLGGAFGHVVSVPRGPTRIARPPDIVALGSLLI